MSLLKQHIEALVFCSENSITLEEIQASLELSMGWELQEEDLLTALEEIRIKYQSEDFAFELCEIAEGYQFLTKKEYHSTLSALIQHKAKKKLSLAQMETLAIIAYKQPISKTEIEHIRGVNCDYAVQKLLEKDLVEIQGKSDGPGRPILYATSQSFMDYFGIKSVTDLPQLKDLHAEQNEIGMASDMLDAEPQPEIRGVMDVERNSESGFESESVSAPVVTEPEVAMEAEDVFETEQSPDVLEVSESEETFIVDTNPEASELPDRRKIYLEAGQNSEEEIEKPDDFSSSSGTDIA